MKQIIKTSTLLFVLIVFYQTNVVFAQFNFVYNDSIVVVKGTDTIPIAWAGGMSHPQFSTIDVDFDGVEELIAFEPSNHMINVFKREIVNSEVIYKYVYNGIYYFPSDVTDRMALVDFNNYGGKDIFTYAAGGIKVYKNTSNPTDGMQWELLTNQIQTEIGGTTTNLHTASIDIPAYKDIDGDGDMDIISSNTVIFRAEWHKNMSQETFGNAEHLLFKLEQPCWGEFIENPTTSVIELHSNMAPCGDGSGLAQTTTTPKHLGGKSFLALDMDASGTMDLIIGHIDFSDLKMLINGETNPDSNAVMISDDENFPSADVPAHINNFLTAYYEDVDLDGVKDLIVSTTHPNNSNNTNGVWLYKNNGVNNNPDFTLVNQDFLQGDMIENGAGSIPIFVDVNKDGLQDLLVANNFNYGDSLPNSSRINYYQNIGTANTPAFKLINEDWQSFSNSGFSGRVSPAFGDLTGDNAPEMIIGTAAGKLYYYLNPNGPGNLNYNIAPIVLKNNSGADIQVSANATPELFDLDNDGLLDLIIGQDNNALLYYKNIGTNALYSFKLMNANLGQVDVSDTNFSSTVAVPRFTRTNNTTYLFVGNRAGKIAFYTDIDDHLSVGEAFDLYSNYYLNINTKGMAAPIVQQLRSDGSYDLFVGNALGGLWSFRPGDTTSYMAINEFTNPIENIVLYPNPNTGSFTIQMNQLQGKTYECNVQDALGRIVYKEQNIDKQKHEIHLYNIKSGVYFVEIIRSDNTRSIQKIILK